MDIINDIETIIHQPKIHVRIVKRNNRQFKTYLENLPNNIDFKDILRKLKIYFSCNGNISIDKDSKIIILQGDHRCDIQRFLLNNKIINNNNDVIIHGF